MAVKLGVKLIHVEAGLRSFDRTMPEEINRILTDSISDLLFVTEQSGRRQSAEGGHRFRIEVILVGNVMIDTLMANREKASRSTILANMDLRPRGYAVITLHRPSNVDDPEVFGRIVAAFEVIEKDMKLIFPIHPRTRNNMQRTDLGRRVEAMQNLILLEPVGYLDFLCLTSNAGLVMTDSGGIQEETTILGVPCMTLRENTERPVTVTEGTNRLVKLTTEDILANYRQIRKAGFVQARIPRLWDGNAAQRIEGILGALADGKGSD